MKKHYLTFVLILSITALQSQTTMKEYNYLTKGYKIAMDNGLDLKRGYTLYKYGDWGKKYNTFERKTTFYAFYRGKEKKPCAMLVVLERSDTDYKKYMCIPEYHSNNDVWDAAYKDWLNTDLSSAYAWGMIQFISYQFSKTDTEAAAEEIMNEVEEN